MQLIIRHFRDLTADELLDLAKLRISVFVVEQRCPYQEMDEYDRDAWHIWLADENGIQAYLRVLPPGKAFPDAAIGRVIAVKRHCGLASRLLQEGIRLGRSAGQMQSSWRRRPTHGDCMKRQDSARCPGNFWRTAFPTFGCVWILQTERIIRERTHEI